MKAFIDLDDHMSDVLLKNAHFSAMPFINLDRITLAKSSILDLFIFCDGRARVPFTWVAKSTIS